MDMNGGRGSLTWAFGSSVRGFLVRSGPVGHRRPRDDQSLKV